MIEQIRPGVSAERARVALFDFDGTLSLIRAGWVDVMVPTMVEILLDLKTGEAEETSCWSGPLSVVEGGFHARIAWLQHGAPDPQDWISQ